MIVIAIMVINILVIIIVFTSDKGCRHTWDKSSDQRCCQISKGMVGVGLTSSGTENASIGLRLFATWISLKVQCNQCLTM